VVLSLLSVQRSPPPITTAVVNRTTLREPALSSLPSRLVRDELSEAPRGSVPLTDGGANNRGAGVCLAAAAGARKGPGRSLEIRLLTVPAIPVAGARGGAATGAAGAFPLLDDTAEETSVPADETSVDADAPGAVPSVIGVLRPEPDGDGPPAAVVVLRIAERAGGGGSGGARLGAGTGAGADGPAFWYDCACLRRPGCAGGSAGAWGAYGERATPSPGDCAECARRFDGRAAATTGWCAAPGPRWGVRERWRPIAICETVGRALAGVEW
jgi:hypothetical protein